MRGDNSAVVVYECLELRFLVLPGAGGGTGRECRGGGGTTAAAHQTSPQGQSSRAPDKMLKMNFNRR